MLPSIWRPTKCDLQRGRKVAARNASTTTATTAMNPTSKRLDQLGSWAAVLSGCAVTRSLPGSRRRLRARSRRFATYSIAEHRNLVRDAIPGLEDADAGDDVLLASLASRWPCEPGEDSVDTRPRRGSCGQRLEAACGAGLRPAGARRRPVMRAIVSRPLERCPSWPKERDWKSRTC